jgi:hypothetical protein
MTSEGRLDALEGRFYALVVQNILLVKFNKSTKKRCGNSTIYRCLRLNCAVWITIE